jgi:hypothetical protein
MATLIFARVVLVASGLLGSKCGSVPFAISKYDFPESQSCFNLAHGIATRVVGSAFFVLAAFGFFAVFFMFVPF